MPISLERSDGETFTATRSPSIVFGGAAFAAGDVVVLWIASQTTATIAAVADWTNVLGGTTDIESDQSQMCCMAHVVTDAEALAGTTDWTLTDLYTTTETGQSLGHVWRGVDASSPIMAAAGTFSNANTATPHVLAGIAAGSVTASNGLVLSCVAVDATSRSWTTPGGWSPISLVASAAPTLGTFIRTALTTAGVAVDATDITPSTGDEYTSITVILSAPPEGRPREKGGYVRKSGLFVPETRRLIGPVGI